MDALISFCFSTAIVGFFAGAFLSVLAFVLRRFVFLLEG